MVLGDLCGLSEAGVRIRVSRKGAKKKNYGQQL